MKDLTDFEVQEAVKRGAQRIREAEALLYEAERLYADAVAECVSRNIDTPKTVMTNPFMAKNRSARK